MEVLYEYAAGSSPLWPLAVFFWAAGIVLVIACICMMIQDREVSYGGVVALILSIFIGVAGFFFMADTRHQEIKATVNDTISWKEINEKYELIKQEGEIYTFRVKEDAGEN